MAAPKLVRTVKKRALASMAIVALFALFAAAQAHAEEEAIRASLTIPIPTVSFSQVSKSGEYLIVPWIAQYVGGVYRYASGIVGIVAGSMIVLGGFQYLTAGGDSGKVGQAKGRIKDATIGMLLVVGAFVILATINPALTQPGGLRVFSIKRQDALPPAKERERVIQSALVPTLVAPGGGTATGTTTEGPGGTTPPPAPGGAPGVAKAGIGVNCGALPKYAAYFPPKAPCSGVDNCEQVLCSGAKFPAPKGVPQLSQLVGFDDFPETAGEQATQKGLVLIAPSGPGMFCVPKKGCDTQKFFSIKVMGPKASQGVKNLVNGGRRFLPEMRDALIKAGAAAKAEGYFIVIGDGFRNMDTQVGAWCQRRKAFKLQGKPGSGGVATPGTSPHQFGMAVDVALYKIDGARMYVVTVGGGICGQVATQKSLGVENLKKLEGFMTAGGLKHMCQEVWHFDHAGAYAIDCDYCEFPGQMAIREQNECGGKK